MSDGVFGPFERMVAFRYLRARRRESVISVIAAISLVGITLGVAALIVVMSVMNGMRQDLFDRIIGVTGHIVVQGPVAGLPDHERLVAELRRIPGVQRVLPVAEGHAVASSGAGGASGVVVRGLSREDLAGKGIIGADDELGEEQVVTGVRLATKLRLTEGDPLSLVRPTVEPDIPGIQPQVRSYDLAGTFRVGMQDYDTSYVFMTIGAARDYLRLTEGATHIEIFVADAARVAETRKQVEAVVGALVKVPGVKVHDWQQVNKSFFNAVKVERNVTFILLTLVILVAAFNIISSLSMLVKDKGRDVAVLRTMGATRGMIMRIFLLSGASVGVAGTLIGLALGLGFALNVDTVRALLQGVAGGMFQNEIRFLANLPARVDPGEVGAAVGIALAISFLATLYPSWRAARLDPVEALRYE